jgi:hypothetical protein
MKTIYGFQRIQNENMQIMMLKQNRKHRCLHSNSPMGLFRRRSIIQQQGIAGHGRKAKRDPLKDILRLSRMDTTKVKAGTKWRCQADVKGTER